MQKSKKILLADDDEGIVDATVMILELLGYEVKSTYDGAAVASLINKQTDLLILDIWMEGIDGRDLCRNIKTNPLTKNIPILMISAGKDIGQSALDSGANDFLEKPFDLEVLAQRIEKLLN